MNEHYFTATPSARSARRTVRLHLPDLDLTLVTDRGTFSAERVDKGTTVLLRHAPRPPERGDLLDLGCGYGPVALTLARRSPAARVWAVDVNERALALTRENAAAAGVGNLVVAHPDEVDPAVRFAAVYANPPVRVGKAALHALLSTWLERLAPTGRGYLVVQRNLGSDSLQRWLGEQGWPTRRLTSVVGYRVLEVSARASAGQH